MYILTQQVDLPTQQVDLMTQQVDLLFQQVDLLTQQVDILPQHMDLPVCLHVCTKGGPSNITGRSTNKKGQMVQLVLLVLIMVSYMFFV